MHTKSIHTLEFPKILERIAREAAFSASKERVLALTPQSSLTEIQRRQQSTSEARRLLELKSDASIQGAHDIRPLVGRTTRGDTLQPPDFLVILCTLLSARHTSQMLGRLDDTFPQLRGLGTLLPVNPHLEHRITATISEEGEVLDSASPALRRIRADVRSAYGRLRDKLNDLLTSSEFASALQEPIITMRADRYVIPVKAEYRSHVRGIVHDQSSSGATVFIEPLVIVDLNNRWRQLQMEETEEIQRVLRALSGEAALQAGALEQMVDVLGEIDLFLAQGRYSQKINGTEPRLNEHGYLNLLEARHPLLSGKVVPITVELGRSYRMIVITGPNTGGKTVALKTIGLLTLMAQAGLHIPAAAPSALAIFDQVFADIGDEQSIEQSLSTFSSHLTRINEILSLLDRNSLVLLDELGAGTDPTEGSALARAILSYLLEQGVVVVATTHYSELKAFAHEQPQVENASVEFDVETLSPTYRLRVGLPGRSNALAIAGRLGLPEAIRDRAVQFLGTTGVQMESLLEGLEVERKGAAAEHLRLAEERVTAERERHALEAQRARLEEQRIELINDARRQAQRELDGLQAQINRLEKDLGRVQLNRNFLDEAREQVRQLSTRTEPIPLPSTPPPPKEQPVGGKLKIGDTVRISSLGQQGELLSLPDSKGEVEVQLGPLKLRVPAENVERMRPQPSSYGSDFRQSITLPEAESRPVPEMQIDLRGWIVEEVQGVLDQYLNDAFLTGLPFVRIVHGKGTGTLRSAVRQQLATHPLVHSFKSGEQKEGGDGVTLVELNRH